MKFWFEAHSCFHSQIYRTVNKIKYQLLGIPWYIIFVNFSHCWILLCTLLLFRYFLELLKPFFRLEWIFQDNFHPFFWQRDRPKSNTNEVQTLEYQRRRKSNYRGNSSRVSPSTEEQREKKRLEGAHITLLLIKVYTWVIILKFHFPIEKCNNKNTALF